MHFNKFSKFWLPVVIYCVIIYVVSSIPQPLPEELEIPYIDKLLHAIEYGILSYLLIRAFLGSGARLTKTSVIILSVILATAYGASDEFHQLFVENRDSSLFDLFFDFLGATFVGLMKIWR
ncbi:MAG: hypothetical protein AMJ78_10700 [Omnitrophica WOR_2 bacterium SM23_29]|nr:MAG: hypothetical protein AMJ78_10700 [Omnitrophica WOR_2 bacterium SM23_29]